MEQSVAHTEEHYADEDVQFGFHHISVDESVTRIEGVEIFNAGQGGRLARYPIHW